MATTRWMAGSLIALALATAPTPAHAQDRLGGVLEWIHRLSGPQFIGPSVSYARGEEVGFRLALAYRWSVASDAQIDPDGRLTMLSLTPTIEFGVLDQLRLGTGAAAHRYGGDVDGFWHWSVPVYAQGVFPASNSMDVLVGAGAHYFFEFEADDFSPRTVTAPRDGGELVPMLFAGLQWRLN